MSVLTQALGQLPEAARAGRILVRTDGAGYSHTFLNHLVAESLEYSISYAVTDEFRDAIAMLPEWAWTDAIDADGGLRDGAQIAEVTTVLQEVIAYALPARDASAALDGKTVTRTADRRPWPEGMQIIVRRDAPTPERNSMPSSTATGSATKR